MSEAGKDLSETKRALLAKRLAGGRALGGETTPIFAIPKRPENEARLATPAQHILWLHDQTTKGHSNSVNAFRLAGGSLSFPRLNEALSCLCQRHEILRSRYRQRGDELEQVVIEGFATKVIQSVASGEEDLVQKARTIGQRPLDVERGPLWELHYIACDTCDDLLVLIVDHLILDKWSMTMLWRELSVLYQEGSRTTLKPVERQFSDYSRWQRDRLGAGLTERQSNYWKRRLANPPPPLTLPSDRPYPEVLSTEGQLAVGTIPKNLSQRLKTFAAEEEVSVFMLSLLAFRILLERLADVDDVIIGTPVANRRSPESADILGFLLSVIPLRVTLSDHLTVREALRNVRDVVLEGIENQDLPPDQIVAVSDPPRIAGRHTLFQVMFVYQRREEAELPLTLDNMEVKPCLIDPGSSRFDLTLFVSETESGLKTIAEFRTDLFDSDTVERWLEQYSQVLECMVDSPDVSLQSLDVRNLQERGFSVSESALEPSGFTTVVGAIKVQCEKSPDAVALRDSEIVCSYAELWRLSACLASEILDTVPDAKRVGIYMGNGTKAIVAVLAVLRCGAAYVPADPSYPALRNEAALKDAGVHVIVTDAEDEIPAELATLAPVIGASFVGKETIVCTSLDNVDAGNLAYILYTSGSSGKPKGVAVSHANLWASTRARNQVYSTSPGCYCLLSSLSFDSSVAGIFWCLSNGETLAVPNAEERRDPACITKWIREFNIDSLLAIPSFYRELLAWDASALKGLKRAIVAGESCPPSLVEQHFKALPECGLDNEYGPTEGTVWATVHHCQQHDALQSSVAIGRPVPGACVYILDRHQRHALTGQQGEIWIGGTGLAKGYWNDTSRTEKHFREVGELGRLYRTGDLGKWLPDGLIEYVGRLDHQLKINGYRIELGEVESVLEAHPQIQEAIVVPVATSSLVAIEEADQVLRNDLREIPESILYEWLQDIEEKAAKSERSVSRDGFRLDLTIKDPTFVKPPRISQRNWLLGQAMEEFASDLEHIDRKAAEFVPGHDGEMDAALSDRSQKPLSSDEIMEDWMSQLMVPMARFAAAAHGDVLEIGFGRGVSAEMVQQHGVRSHTVVEMNDHSVNHYYKAWRARYPDRDIRLLHGRWQDVMDEMGVYDGILFHAYPMTEKEFEEYVMGSVTFAEHAFAPMASLLKPGGVFTYMTTEIDSLSRRHQRLLFQHFRSIELQVERFRIPEDTRDSWWSDSMVVIKAVK